MAHIKASLFSGIYALFQHGTHLNISLRSFRQIHFLRLFPFLSTAMLFSHVFTAMTAIIAGHMAVAALLPPRVTRAVVTVTSSKPQQTITSAAWVDWPVVASFPEPNKGGNKASTDANKKDDDDPPRSVQRRSAQRPASQNAPRPVLRQRPSSNQGPRPRPSMPRRRRRPSRPNTPKRPSQLKASRAGRGRRPSSRAGPTRPSQKQAPRPRTGPSSRRPARPITRPSQKQAPRPRTGPSSRRPARPLARPGIVIRPEKKKTLTPRAPPLTSMQRFKKYQKARGKDMTQGWLD